MFNADEIKCLDSKYFTIIYTDVYDVTIQSKNTGHYWSLHNPEYPTEGQGIVFHSHHADKTGRVPYHLHGRAKNLRQAIKSIKSHDAFQLNGRRPIRKSHR